MIVKNVIIRRVSVDEVEHLQNISKRTFSEAFSAGTGEASMEKYLNEGFTLEKLNSELKNKDSEFYFATIDNTIVGYLKINFGESQTELKDERALEIQRIYLLKEFHGEKVGQRLYEKAMQIATEANANYIWLGVWEENPRAINFYKKNGFVEFDKRIFKLGDENQTDIMMKRQLTER